MSDDYSNGMTGDTLESLKAEREEMEKTVACVRQMTRDFDTLAERRKTFEGKRVAFHLQLKGPHLRRCVWKGFFTPEAFQWHKGAIARKKALGEQMLKDAAAFCQALVRWAEDLERREQQFAQEAINREKALKQRQSRGTRPDAELPVAVAATAQVPALSSPSLESPTMASEPGSAPEPVEPDVPDLGPATVVAGGASAASVTSLAWALDASIVAGTREANIVNYGNPYGPKKYSGKASFTGDDPQSAGDTPQPQAQPVSPPPPNTPPIPAPAGFPGDEPNEHHWFPQQFEDWFSASPRNIDIDDYVTQMPQQWHTGAEISIHSNGYNAAWKAFIEAYPDASFSETLNFMNALKNSMGFGQGF